MGRRRARSRTDPRSRCKICPMLLTRAPGFEQQKTANTPGSRDAPVVCPQYPDPHATLQWGEEGGRGRTSLSSDASEPGGCFHCLGPRRRTEARAPTLCSDSLHERKEYRQLLPAPYIELLKSAIKKCKIVSHRNHERIPLRSRGAQPRSGRAAASFSDAKANGPETLEITG